MPRAFVLVNAELGYETTLADEMKGISGVNEAYTIYGVYDLLLKVEAQTMDKPVPRHACADRYGLPARRVSDLPPKAVVRSPRGSSARGR